MKKQVIAAAVAAAFAVPAVAQVTISGRIDTSVGSFTNNAGLKHTRVNAALLTTPQLVLSGTEDLGGGLSAFFNTATQLDGSDGTFSWGNRGFVVGLRGGFGSVTLGKDMGLTIDAIATSGVVNNLGNYSVLNNRLNNTVSYTSPSINGFNARVVYSAGNDSDIGANTAGTITSPLSNRQTEVSVSYAAGPLLVRAASSNNENVQSAAVSSSSVNSFGSPVTSAAYGASSASKVIENGISVNYNLGFMAANGRFVDRKTTNPSSGLRNEKFSGVGVSVPFGNTSVNVDVFKFNSSVDTRDIDAVSLTAVNTLSKRTNAYVAYQKRDIKHTVTDEAVMAVGVRHSF